MTPREIAPGYLLPRRETLLTVFVVALLASTSSGTGTALEAERTAPPSYLAVPGVEAQIESLKLKSELVLRSGVVVAQQTTGRGPGGETPFVARRNFDVRAGTWKVLLAGVGRSFAGRSGRAVPGRLPTHRSGAASGVRWLDASGGYRVQTRGARNRYLHDRLDLASLAIARHPNFSGQPGCGASTRADHGTANSHTASALLGRWLARDHKPDVRPFCNDARVGG